MSQAGLIGTSAMPPPVTGSVGFQALIGASQPAVTGDGTALTVVFDAVVWETGGNNYDPLTGIFTVPSDGKYLVNYSLTLTDVASGNTSSTFLIGGSLGTASITVTNPGAAHVGGFYYITNSFLIDITAGATIFVNGSVSGTGMTVGLQGEAFGQYSYFSIIKLAD